MRQIVDNCMKEDQICDVSVMILLGSGLPNKAVMINMGNPSTTQGLRSHFPLRVILQNDRTGKPEIY